MVQAYGTGNQPPAPALYQQHEARARPRNVMEPETSGIRFRESAQTT